MIEVGGRGRSNPALAWYGDRRCDSSCAAEQELAEDQALEKLQEKSKEFVEKGSKVTRKLDRGRPNFAEKRLEGLPASIVNLGRAFGSPPLNTLVFVTAVPSR